MRVKSMEPATLLTVPRSQTVPFTTPHLVGINGSGMKSLAELLRDVGCRITGSDQSSPGGHCESNVPSDCDALVYSPAVADSNPERRAASRRGIPQWSLIETIALLMESREGICVAGTHGKSTTAALIAWILQSAGREPSAFIGASLCDDKRNALGGRGGWAGEGDLFVVESCEYQRNFLTYPPSHAIILNIEPDHFDTFPDESALLAGFTEFAANVPSDGLLLMSADSHRCKQIAASLGRPVETFGPDASSDWCIRNSQQTSSGRRFQVCRGNRLITEIDSPLPGSHNQRNVLAAVVMCSNLGVEADRIQEGVRTFPGISRRFESLGEHHGVLYFDDYAHHPTAVRVTLETARQRFPNRRLWCVFQPHQLTRTRRLMDDFTSALAIADAVVIPPVFAARETGGEQSQQCALTLVENVKSRMPSSADCRFLPSLDRILPTLEDEARPGDVVILMGAGDIERIGHELVGRIL